MKSYFRARYDEDLAVALYEMYEDGDDSVLNELLGQLCPLIHRTYAVKIGKSKPADRDTLEADALLEVLRIVQGKSLPHHHPRVFTKFVTTVIVRSMYDTLNGLKRQEFDYATAGKSPPLAQMTSAADVERVHYHQQVLRQVRETVLDDIRFPGVEHEACEFILDSLLGISSVAPTFAKRKFNIHQQRVGYLIRCVNIWIKHALMEIRDHDYRGRTVYADGTSGRGVLRTAAQFR